MVGQRTSVVAEAAEAATAASVEVQARVAPGAQV